MSNKPLVSIGLPTYNRASTLGRSIESALAQHYLNIELVISDNASTDETQAICLAARQRDVRVKYLRQQSNQGPLANFREVLKQSSGQFFMWLADDDWLDRSYVSKCVEVLLASPTHSLVSGKTKYYDHGRLVLEEQRINLLDDSGKKRVLAYYDQVIWNGITYGLMRREQLAGLSLEDKLGADWLLIAAIVFMGKIETLEDVCNYRSIDGMSKDMKKFAEGFGLTGFMARNPHLNIAINVFETIAWKWPIYRSLSLPARLVLGFRSFATICRRFVLTSWRQRALTYLNKLLVYLHKSHPRLTHAAKVIKNKLTRSLRHG
ncbi:MAG: hypothetical protein QOH25_3945 [Acidobacteriota bacterium]|jgi:glycosyltransferase involved in cell wall biosynthesis|nr:hypothetical protein [Acidobacteriota bacterium]